MRYVLLKIGENGKFKNQCNLKSVDEVIRGVEKGEGFEVVNRSGDIEVERFSREHGRYYYTTRTNSATKLSRMMMEYISSDICVEEVAMYASINYMIRGELRLLYYENNYNLPNDMFIKQVLGEKRRLEGEQAVRFCTVIFCNKYEQEMWVMDYMFGGRKITMLNCYNDLLFKF